MDQWIFFFNLVKQQCTMNRNRKNRLNLSLVKKTESPKSPDRERFTETTSECKTPFNSRKRSSTFSDGSPVMNDYEYPFPMTQDTSNIVTGVSWAWNSPKRIIPEECRPKPRPLLASNIMPPKEPDLRKKTTERLVGFYKFQEELKKIQQEAPRNAAKEIQNKQSVMPSSPSSPNGTDLFHSFEDDEVPIAMEGDVQRPKNLPADAQSDSFNDSAVDILLLQASQAVENNPHIVSNAAGLEKTPKKRKSLVKSRTINDLDSVAIHDLLNDSTDFCLIEASQMVEGNLNDSNQKTAEPGGYKKTNTLTRHKSMPTSPSQNISVSHNLGNPSPLLRSKFENFYKRDLCLSAAPANESASNQPARLCTKEEIEQKRQEALKRQQARRLYRRGLGNSVLNNNHLANAAVAARKS